MPKDPLQAFKSLDLEIEKHALAEAQSRVARSNGMQRLLRKSNEELEVGISIYAEGCADYTRAQGGKAIPLKEYLDNHPEILQRNAQREERRFGLRWTEHTRKHTRQETEFLKQARELYGGRFGEVLAPIAVPERGKIRKALAYCAQADGVSARAINKAVDFVARGAKTIYLVHNHPDFYRDSKVPPEAKLEGNGFITNGALSRRDIVCADRVQKRVGKDTQVVMISINEDGHTHAYVAGTSSKYKWC